MEQVKQNVSSMKKLGGILIIAGTSIGAGMLGIPYAVAAVGFFGAVILLLVTWLVMLATAMLIVEVNVRQPLSADLNTMAKNTLGRSGQVVNWVAYLLLLYSLTTAYISMGGSLIDQYVFHIVSRSLNWHGALVFTLVLGVIVYLGTLVVDQLNKLFFTLKALCFIGLVIFVIPHVQQNLLTQAPVGVNYAWYAFPILTTSFGFHIVIPTIRNYFRNDRVLKKVVVAGASVPMVVYLVWAVVTLGVIPIQGEYGFVYMMKHGVDLGVAYQKLLGVKSASAFIIAFSNIAVTTSFLGVTLALFHFNQDAYKLKKHKMGRIINFIITYLPPFIFAVFFINGFLMALGYASIFVCILLIILPVFMVWKVRHDEARNGFASKAFLILVGLAGVLIIFLQLLSAFGLLPVL